MSFSLYDASIPSFVQTVHATIGLLDKAEAFCIEKGFLPEDLIDAKLADDMLPFGYQVKSVTVHSRLAVEGVRAGLFSPNRERWPNDFSAMKAQLADTAAFLNAIGRDEIDAMVGRDVAFVFGEHRMDFLAEDFLMSFSMPNFYFHATPAYAILRMKGVDIGKMDFMGRPRVKQR